MDDTVLGGRYRRLRRLGRGAMGEVWLAEDTLLHRNVALKSVSSAYPAEPTDLNRIMREARLAARLNHPNAVAVYDVVTDAGNPYVVMEYVPGVSLSDRIAAEGRLLPNEVATIGIAVADALSDAHRLGIVHRDVKPGNILVTERGVPKLADFGIARLALDAENTATGLTIGTPAYLAPELARGGDADPRSDIWALGVTLYAALDGRSPFQQPGDNAVVVIGRLANAPVASPPVNGGALTPTVMRMLAVDPQRRPSAEDVVGMLRSDIAAGAPTNRWAMPMFSDAPQASPAPAALHPAPPPVVPLGDRPEDATTQFQRVPPAHRRRTAIISGAAAIVVAAGGVVAGLLLTRGGGGTDHPQGTGSSSVPIASSRPSSAPAIKGIAYKAPGGITVTAPKGWQPDDSAHIPNIRDYVAPDETRNGGTFFRIGIGNPAPESTIQKEAQGAIAFLTGPSNPYKNVKVLATTYPPFLNTTAAEIEYTGRNSEGVERHAIERLWIANGVTREIILNTTAAQWDTYRPLYDNLIASAKVGA